MQPDRLVASTSHINQQHFTNLRPPVRPPARPSIILQSRRRCSRRTRQQRRTALPSSGISGGAAACTAAAAATSDGSQGVRAGLCALCSLLLHATLSTGKM